MLISGREARFILEAAGFSTRHARTALNSGLAGTPILTCAAHLFDEARVQDLATRPEVDWVRLIEACPQGMFVARRSVDVTRPRDELLEEAGGGWHDVSPWTWMAMCFHIEEWGSLPFVATVAAVVVVGADIVGTSPGHRLDLVPPGRWYDAVEGTRLPTGPGRPWSLYLDGRRRAS